MKRRIIPILLCFPFSLFGQTGGSAAAEAFYNRGLEFAADENRYAALESFLEAVKQNPAHAGASLALAECYYELAEYDQSLSWVKKARTLSRLSTEAANLEAFILIAMGRLTEADAIIGDVLKREPYNQDALFAAGELDIARGRSGDAVRRYREAERLYPRDRRLLLSLALVLSSLGDTAAARAFIDRAQIAHPEDYRVFYYAAYLKARSGNLREAISDAEKTLTLRPGYQPARSLLAQLRYRSGAYGRAISLADEVIADNRSDTGAWFLRGMALSRMGQGTEARRSFETAVNIDPSDEWSRAALETSLLEEIDVEDRQRVRWADWHFVRARQYKQRSLYEDALFEYRRGLRLNPYAQQRAEYAEILLRQGFRKQYLDEMLFIQNETGTANKAVNDAVETYTALLKTGFAAQNPVDDREIKPRWNIAIFSLPSQSSFYHSDGVYIAARYLKDLTVHNRSLHAMDLPVRRATFSEAFSTARENKADYFLILDVNENERDLSLSAVLYVARTGSKAAEFTVFRAGSDRLRNASRAIVDQVSAALPFRAVLLRRQANRGIIDRGRLDKLPEDAVLNVVKAGRAETKNEGLGITYHNADITGVFTVTQIDEAISGGALDRAGFFDIITPGDEILPAKVPQPKVFLPKPKR
ncbi:MAG: tetratricopeptide repeat protein [Spirochaetaceae bacterium]|jgi:tetratricopeptide (TPR) repeat protein|nr:tetratricopeptide repeat protein [Spirochaetaceae bacterium]